MRKQKKGISLIVLVITILVMIILAGAVIITLNNTNIINKANTAVSETDKATEKEAMSVAVASSLSKDGIIDFEYLDSHLPTGVSGTNGIYEGYVTYTVSQKGRITTDGTSEEETAIGVPGGNTVTFVSEGEIYSIQSVKAGQGISKPLTNPTPSKNGHEIFSGWGLSEATTSTIKFPYTPQNNIRLYALFDLTDEDMVLATNGAKICVLGGRAYTTATSNPVVCGYFYASSGYTMPIVISKNSADAKFRSGPMGVNTSEGSVQYDGETWYYSNSGSAMGGNCTSTATDLVKLVKLNATTGETAAKELLDRYHYNYSE